MALGLHTTRAKCSGTKLLTGGTAKSGKPWPLHQKTPCLPGFPLVHVAVLIREYGWHGKQGDVERFQSLAGQRVGRKETELGGVERSRTLLGRWKGSVTPFKNPSSAYLT